MVAASENTRKRTAAVSANAVGNEPFILTRLYGVTADITSERNIIRQLMAKVRIDCGSCHHWVSLFEVYFWWNTGKLTMSYQSYLDSLPKKEWGLAVDG